MYRFLYRPLWLLLHVVVVATIVLMINLGFWQLSRYQERTAFNKVVTQRIASPVVPITELLIDLRTKGETPTSLEWRTVQVVGEYLDDKTVVVVNRSQGGFSGKDPLTPLVLDNGTLVLINRGFLPLATQVAIAPRGRVELIGRVRISETRRHGRLSDPVSGILREVINIDLDRLSKQMPTPLAPIYVEMFASKPEDSILLSQIASPVLSSGSHLSYTVQWFMFSIFVVFGWVVVVRRKLKAPKTSI